ncbi:MAG: dihydrolipoamide acetyltransferase family protein [Deltaproteobacteria bacterium]|nr:dihydrolipoamide acetyltransferase family protein [Deltaproteobacteria bacterium]
MEWKMPDLGEGVQEGEVIRWLVKEGDKVTFDQHLVEIMTDKATMEIPCPMDGVVQQIVLKEGAIAKIGQTLAIIGEGAGEQKPNAQNQTPKEEEKMESRETKEETKIENEKQKSEARSTKNEVPSERSVRPDLPQGGPLGVEGHPSQKPLASPAVRQFARDKGLDLTRVKGSGPGGRILKEDLEKDSGHRTSNIEHREGEERVPLRGLRRKIAEHMVLSLKTAAHFTHVDEADFTELMALRESAKKVAEAKGVKLTYLPFILKAVIEGLKKFPSMNASLDDQTHEVILKKYFNIGIAVATEDGLMVPVIKNADTLGLLDLAREIKRLSEAARARKIALEDLKGGTFTLTNIGSIGGMFSSPVINYPEVAIMGLHKIKPTPVVRDNKIVVRQMMYISIAADHRVVDGAEVASFLNTVIEFIEHPVGDLVSLRA